PIAGHRLLDIGCGEGALVRLLTRNGGQAVGLDPQWAQIARARAAGPEPYVVGWGQHLPFADASFDIVLFFNALHHVPVEIMGAALDEARRVLKREGLLAVLEPVAAGTHFELLQPVEDETEVRAEAEATLARQERAGRLKRRAQERYAVALRFGAFDEWRDTVLAVDPERRPALDRLRPTLERRFIELGELEGDGRRLFRQPARFDLYQPG
ncbi:MAG TPA: class I SAM-dependent methyltransferase, partial [Kiloniellales bacterium]|nr:class I SAM-dependent methyltransferase [Kiloniellales bacterium]